MIVAWKGTTWVTSFEVCTRKFVLMLLSLRKAIRRASANISLVSELRNKSCCTLP